MMKKFAVAAILGVAIAASSAQAQFRVGVNVGNPWNGVSTNFGSAPIYGTPTYVYNGGSYYNGTSYYAPSYDSGVSYYSSPGYDSGVSYYSSPGYYSSGATYYSSPGVSIGFGAYPSWGYGGLNRGYYGGFNQGWGGRGFYRGGRWR